MTEKQLAAIDRLRRFCTAERDLLAIIADLEGFEPQVREDQVFMERVNRLALRTCELVESQVQLTKERGEALYEQVGEALEKFFGYPNYAVYN
jgi:hypothetical protein